MIHGSRAALQARNRPSTQTVTVAALHTLALTFFPRWFRQIEAYTGALDSRLLPDDFHTCLQAVAEGGYDFLLTFYHPNVPLPLDPEQFPYRVVGFDSLIAVRSALRTEEQATLPILSYSKNSFLDAAHRARQQEVAMLGVLGGMDPMATVDSMGKVVQNTPAIRDQDHIQMVVCSAANIPDRTAAILGRT